MNATGERQAGVAVGASFLASFARFVPGNGNSAARFDQNQLCKWFGAYNFFALNMEHITMKTVASHGRLSISGLGWSCSATFVVLFVLCMLAALFMPLRLAHGWIGLWSDAPIDSSRVWIDGLIWSVVVGWLVALVFGTIYNSIVARRALHEIS
jgi:hypothetical protein